MHCHLVTEARQLHQCWTRPAEFQVRSRPNQSPEIRVQRRSKKSQSCTCSFTSRRHSRNFRLLRNLGSGRGPCISLARGIIILGTWRTRQYKKVGMAPCKTNNCWAISSLAAIWLQAHVRILRYQTCLSTASTHTSEPTSYSVQLATSQVEINLGIEVMHTDPGCGALALKS